MADAIRLDGKVAIITGGAGGIGAATARLMTARGAKVVVADIMLDAAKRVAGEYDGAMALHLDLESEASIKGMITAAVAHFGRIDILHNNAALLGPDIAQADGDVEHMSTALWDRTFAVNTRGTMIACREALPHLIATNDNIIGRLVRSPLDHERGSPNSMVKGDAHGCAPFMHPGGGVFGAGRATAIQMMDDMDMDWEKICGRAV